MLLVVVSCHWSWRIRGDASAAVSLVNREKPDIYRYIVMGKCIGESASLSMLQSFISTLYTIFCDI